MTEPTTDSLLLTRIVIERRLVGEGVTTVEAVFEDNNGDRPSLVKILGTLEVAKATALYSDNDDDDDDCTCDCGDGE